VIDDRARGAMLCSLAGLILPAGGVWFGRAAPDDEGDRIRAWRVTAVSSSGQMRARSARRLSTDAMRGR
jgi:hypothetical protein